MKILYALFIAHLYLRTFLLQKNGELQYIETLYLIHKFIPDSFPIKL